MDSEDPLIAPEIQSGTRPKAAACGWRRFALPDPEPDTRWKRTLGRPASLLPDVHRQLMAPCAPAGRCRSSSSCSLSLHPAGAFVFVHFHLTTGKRDDFTPSGAFFAELSIFRQMVEAAAIVALIERRRGNLLAYNP